MHGIDMQSMFAAGISQLPHVWDLFARMSVAALLGACLAYRCWRPWLRSVMPPGVSVRRFRTV